MTQKHEPAMPSVVKVRKHNPITGETVLERLTDGGLTKAEYAAIHTGQPVSGTPWLDDMIRAQRRERLAGQALIGLVPEEGWRLGHPETVKDIESLVNNATVIADSLIAALEGGDK